MTLDHEVLSHVTFLGFVVFVYIPLDETTLQHLLWSLVFLGICRLTGAIAKRKTFNRGERKQYIFAFPGEEENINKLIRSFRHKKTSSFTV